VRRKVILTTVIVCVLGLLVGSGTVFAAKGGNPGPPGGGGGSVDISIFNFGYNPASFTVGVTGEATWRDDEGKHTVTFTTLSIDSGSLSKGKTFTADFSTVASGTYSYYCTIHGFNKMNGTIVK
jgi:plastocyanin